MTQFTLTADATDQQTGMAGQLPGVFQVNELLPASGAHWGAYVGPISTTGEPVLSFEAMIGRKLGVVTQYHDWSTGASGLFPSPVEKSLCASGSGRLLMIHQALRVFSTNATIMCADVLAGVYDSQIKANAHAVAAWGQPCWYVFEAEMDNAAGRKTYASPSEFTAAWRYVHSLWQAEGAVNAQWVWCVTGSNRTADPALWPGEDVVNWIGFDPYCWGHDAFTLPSQLWASFPAWLAGQSFGEGKPLAVCETGCCTPTHPSDQWWADAPNGQAASGASVVCSFDRNEGADSDWLIEGTPSTLAAYKTAGLQPVFNPGK